MAVGGMSAGLIGVVMVIMIGSIIVTLSFTVSTYNVARGNGLISSGGRAFANGSSCADGEDRRKDAYLIREKVDYAEYALGVPCHPGNGDEGLYPATLLGSYTKGMHHDALGQGSASDFAALVFATQTGVPAHYDAIPLGGVRKFTNPQAGAAETLVGSDSHAFYAPPSPAFSSAQFAHELAENYWMALARDVNFDEYGTTAVTLAAAGELSTYADYGGPYPVLASSNLFRGTSVGCDVGPYISQFLYQPCWFGANQIDQKMMPATGGVDFMSNWTEFLNIQRGANPTAVLTFDPTARYIINGRDLANWVHVDVLFQAYFHAVLILLNTGAPLKTTIPYQTTSLNQMGFGTFGGPGIATSVTEIATAALKAAWFQKWNVHRKLRPEAAGGRVDRTKNLLATFPLHPDILSSAAVNLTNATKGSWLLSQAFPEGSPLHPAYVAGHATVAGACVTILKFWFQEDYVLPSPLMPDANGSTLVPYTGPPLTVGGELNKLANNIALGRNIAGVHWRSDAVESLKLGEQLAISFLRDQKPTYNEIVAPWMATSFDGTLLVV